MATKAKEVGPNGQPQIDQSTWNVKCRFGRYELPETPRSARLRRLAALAGFYFFAKPGFTLVGESPNWWDSTPSFGGGANELGIAVLEMVSDLRAARITKAEFCSWQEELLNRIDAKGIGNRLNLEALLRGWSIFLLERLLDEPDELNYEDARSKFALIHVQELYGFSVIDPRTAFLKGEDEDRLMAAERGVIDSAMKRLSEFDPDHVPAIEFVWMFRCMAADLTIQAGRLEHLFLKRLGKPERGAVARELRPKKGRWSSWDRKAFAYWKHNVEGAKVLSLNSVIPKLPRCDGDRRAPDALRSVRKCLRESVALLPSAIRESRDSYAAQSMFPPYDLSRHLSEESSGTKNSFT